MLRGGEGSDGLSFGTRAVKEDRDFRIRGGSGLCWSVPLYVNVPRPVRKESRTISNLSADVSQESPSFLLRSLSLIFELRHILRLCSYHSTDSVVCVLYHTGPVGVKSECQRFISVLRYNSSLKVRSFYVKGQDLTRLGLVLQ